MVQNIPVILLYSDGLDLTAAQKKKLAGINALFMVSTLYLVFCFTTGIRVLYSERLVTEGRG